MKRLSVGKKRLLAVLLAFLTLLAWAFLGSKYALEVTHEQMFGRDLTALFEEAGATVLNRTYEDVTVNGQTIGYTVKLEASDADFFAEGETAIYGLSLWWGAYVYAARASRMISEPIVRVAF